jgi:glycosyltransferase involved in cell wall biosynthesis
MRILHLIDSDGIYGAEQVLLYLARETQRRGDECVIGSIRPPATPATPFEELARSWQIEVVPIRIAPRPTPDVVFSLLRIVRGVKADVTHSHGYKANILLGRLPRSVRGPMMATLHGWTELNGFSVLGLYQRVDRFSMRGMDAVVVVARSILQLPAIRSLGEGRAVLIENGVPPLQERLADQHRAAVTDLPAAVTEFVARNPTLVAIGRLSSEKGFDLLLEAFAHARIPRSVQLLVIGDGPARDELEQKRLDYSLSDRVMLAGYVGGPDRALANAAGFVMSSLTEGLPLVLLEALQWNVPIVATRVGAIPDLLEGHRRSFLIPASDVAAMSRALERLLADGVPQRSYLARDNDEGAERYSSVRMASEYATVYRRVLGTN